MGPMLTSDGRFKGTLDVQTVTCTDVCTIRVPAPGMALVFFNRQDPPISIGQAPLTFSTSAVTKTRHTASYDTAVLATSNGQSEKDRYLLGASSPGSVRSSAGVVGVALSLSAAVAAGVVCWTNFMRAF